MSYLLALCNGFLIWGPPLVLLAECPHSNYFKAFEQKRKYYEGHLCTVYDVYGDSWACHGQCNESVTAGGALLCRADTMLQRRISIVWYVYRTEALHRWAIDLGMGICLCNIVSVLRISSLSAVVDSFPCRWWVLDLNSFQCRVLPHITSSSARMFLAYKVLLIGRMFLKLLESNVRECYIPLVAGGIFIGVSQSGHPQHPPCSVESPAPPIVPSSSASWWLWPCGSSILILCCQ